MNNKKNYILLLAGALAFGCEQDIPELTPPQVVVPTGTSGSADFTKYVSVGNSLTAGFQANALFTEGQNNSYPAIMAKQFAYVSTNDSFDQPDINSVNGYNASFSNPGAGVILGRLILFDADGAGPKTPSPVPSGAPGVPAPYNTADLPTPYTGDKTKLNNFGVPGILLGQVLTPLTGGPSTANPAYNGLYARFASNPGTSTILGDAIAQQPTFFSFWLGNNDVLGYATSGGAGLALTDPAAFQGQYNLAIGQLLSASASTKGIVSTIPDVTSIPYFTTVKYNAIPLDAGTASVVNTGFGGFNQVLSVIQGNGTLMANFGLTSADLEARKISFAASATNRIVIADKTLTDLGNVFDYLASNSLITATQRAQLAPYEQARQATAADLITLGAGSVLGTTVGGDPLLVVGVSVPLADQYVLSVSEVAAVKERTNEFNNIIKTIVTANADRLALADINKIFADIANGSIRLVDGMPVAATFAPPAGIFSEDGVHPNSRGAAYIAKVFIEAINAKFNASVPGVNLSQFRGTAVPVTP